MKTVALTPEQEDALRDVLVRAQRRDYGPQKPTRIDHEIDEILRKLNTADEQRKTRCRKTWPGRLSCPDEDS